MEAAAICTICNAIPISCIPENLCTKSTEGPEVPAHVNTAFFHGDNFCLSGSAPSPDNRAGMPHPSAGGCCQSGDKADDRFCHMFFDKSRSIFLGAAADFPHHHHPFCRRIVFKGVKAFNECCTINGVPSDADTGGLADTLFGQLMHHFIGKG